MYRQRLIAFYEYNNPACLGSVDDILEIFEGREEELFRVLEEKYGIRGNDLASLSNGNASVTALRESQENLPSSAKQVANVPRKRSGSSSRQVRRKITEPPSAKNKEVLELRSRLQATHVQRNVDEPTDTTGKPSEPGAPSRSQQQVGEESFPNVAGNFKAEIEKLSSINLHLRKEIIVLQAEKEALRRQKRKDEELLKMLRERIAESNEREYSLLQSLGARELETDAPLHENEFMEIIRRSQEQLAAFYEDRISFMQNEMENFFVHASSCLREKDSIIEALKKENA